MRYFLLDINKGFSPFSSSPFSSTSQNKKTPQWNRLYHADVIGHPQGMPLRG
jgi:hypothetical protein